MTPTQPPGLRADEREALAPKAFRIPESGTPWWQTAKDVGAWTDRNEGDVGYVHFGSTEALRVYTVKVTQQAINADRAARAALTPQPATSEEREGLVRRLRDHEKLAHEDAAMTQYPDAAAYARDLAVDLKEAADALAQPAAPVVIYSPIETRPHRDGRHPNDNEPNDPDRRQYLDLRGDDKGQGLDCYWKWGHAAGWNDHKRLAASVAVPEGYALVKVRDEAHRKQLIADAMFPAPTQPAAPAVPEAMKHAPIRGDEPRSEQESAAAYVNGWNACRAAMLAASQPPASDLGNTPYDEGPFTLAQPAAQQAAEGEPTGCNCRWVGERQVQWCELHEAHEVAIHEWAGRAKDAEAKLRATPATQPAEPSELVAVPLQVLEDARAAIGNFLMDHGWGDSDMRAGDNLDAYINQHKSRRAALDKFGGGR